MFVPRSTLARYSAAIAIVVVATLARLAIDPYLGDRGPLAFYFTAVFLASWLGGLGPGLVSIVLSAALATFVFMEPRRSFVARRPENLIGLAIFCSTGLIIAFLSHSQRLARRKAEANARSALDRQAELEAEVDRRERVEERFRLAEQALREADRRKDEFLAVLAHEIRNPLASIRNSLRLMEVPPPDLEDDPSERESERSMAERQVAHLARLVDDLMDVSRISQGRIELRKEPVDLADVVARAVEAARPSVEARDHQLTVDLPTGPIPLQADPTRLEQVFGNLLGNAAKYTPPGGRVAVSARVDLQTREVVLAVRDSGLGISAEMLSNVFEMFVQDANHSGHAQGGLGIGLGLSRSLVELHGGSISARSAGPGFGSEFEVRLPLGSPLDRPPAPARDGRATDRTAPSRRRVLVVDDNEAIARSLARILERSFGQEVRVAHDGPSALELADEFQPEVVFLDIGLPEMDGFEVARRLRSRPEFAETMIVALTGWGQEDDRRRSSEAGIDHHLVKPVDPDDLGRVIASAKTRAELNGVG